MSEINQNSAVNQSDETLPSEAQSLGGWLIIVAIGLILSILISIVKLAEDFRLMSEVRAEFSGIISYDILFNAVFLIFAIYCAIKFFTRKREAPKLMQALFLVNVFGMIFALLISASNKATSSAVPIFAAELGKSLIPAIIWINYFRVSERVKKTFLR